MTRSFRVDHSSDLYRPLDGTLERGVMKLGPRSLRRLPRCSSGRTMWLQTAGGSRRLMVVRAKLRVWLSSSYLGYTWSSSEARCLWKLSICQPLGGRTAKRGGLGVEGSMICKCFFWVNEDRLYGGMGPLSKQRSQTSLLHVMPADTRSR